jgi:hypothetical protein
VRGSQPASQGTDETGCSSACIHTNSSRLEPTSTLTRGCRDDRPSTGGTRLRLDKADGVKAYCTVRSLPPAPRTRLVPRALRVPVLVPTSAGALEAAGRAVHWRRAAKAGAATRGTAAAVAGRGSKPTSAAPGRAAGSRAVPTSVRRATWPAPTGRPVPGRAIARRGPTPVRGRTIEPAAATAEANTRAAISPTGGQSVNAQRHPAL